MELSLQSDTHYSLYLYILKYHLKFRLIHKVLYLFSKLIFLHLIQYYYNFYHLKMLLILIFLFYFVFKMILSI